MDVLPDGELVRRAVVDDSHEHFGLSASDIWVSANDGAYHWDGSVWAAKTMGMTTGVGNSARHLVRIDERLLGRGSGLVAEHPAALLQRDQALRVPLEARILAGREHLLPRGAGWHQRLVRSATSRGQDTGSARWRVGGQSQIFGARPGGRSSAFGVSWQKAEAWPCTIRVRC